MAKGEYSIVEELFGHGAEQNGLKKNEALVVLEGAELHLQGGHVNKPDCKLPLESNTIKRKHEYSVQGASYTPRCAMASTYLELSSVVTRPRSRMVPWESFSVTMNKRT